MQQLYKTEKTTLNTEEIEELIQRHERESVPRLTDLWAYYEGKNPTILNREKSDPDNRTPFAYGRKIINTFTGYAYRPGYINYRDAEGLDTGYFEEMQRIFKLNSEPIKTERAGRNTGIFGTAYELHYLAGVVDEKLDVRAVPRFFPVDPREVILLYDMQPEPEKRIAIRYYKIGDDTYNVELYEMDRVLFYTRVTKSHKAVYTLEREGPNFYEAIPITAYYMGDERLGLIEPVVPLIDDFDLITSDSMIEFSRFANAYLRIVGGTMVDENAPDETGKRLRALKRFRIFQKLTKPDDISFLTKDIPKEFIEYMSNHLRDQIHAQSHVPDFGSEKFAGALSGAAIERMLYDFNNVVSSAEADFDQGLYDRMRLVTTILEKTVRLSDDPTKINISHRRNVPVDNLNAAQTAVQMRNAGFSMLTVVENMPDDMIPDDGEEIKRQAEEREQMAPDLDQFKPKKEEEDEEGEETNDPGGT